VRQARETQARVLIVSDTLKYVNGVTRLYQGVLEEIAGSHPHVSVAVLYPDEKDKVEPVAGNVRLISHRPLGAFRMPGYPQMIAGVPRRAAFRKAEEALGGVDLVHLTTQGFFGYFARRWADRRDIPMVGFYHTCMPRYAQFYLARRLLPGKAMDALCRKAGESLDRLVFGGCRSLFCHTGGMRDILAGYLPVKVSLATEFLILDQFRREGGLPERPGDGRMQLGYVGRIAREKSLGTVMRHLPGMEAAGITFHIVGEGPHLAQLPNLGLAVLHGCLHGKALADSYRLLDFLVVPSTSETMCIAMLEAAACGVPSVVLAGTAPAEVLQRYRCGLAVESMDDAAWIETVLKVRGSARYRQMRQNCLRLAEDNSIARGTSILVEAWKRTIGGGGPVCREPAAPFRPQGLQAPGVGGRAGNIEAGAGEGAMAPLPAA
jgi:glycosyltransferase involved in cell wall biosynthesis